MTRKTDEELHELVCKELDRNLGTHLSMAGSVGLSVINENGNVNTPTYQLCHGQLYHQLVSGTKRFVASAIMSHSPLYLEEPITDEIKLAYLDYLMNNSVVSPAFYDKSPQGVLEKGMCVFDCRTPANLFLMALFSFRIMWEKQFTVKIWYDLMQYGMLPDLAFFLSQCTQAFTSRSENKFRFSPHGSTHFAFSTRQFNFKGISNFINQNPTLLTALYSEGGNLGKVDRMFIVSSESETCPDSGEFTKFSEEFQHSTIDVFLNNPFVDVLKSKLGKNQKGCSYDRYIDAALEFAPKLLMQLEGIDDGNKAQSISGR